MYLNANAIKIEDFETEHKAWSNDGSRNAQNGYKKTSYAGVRWKTMTLGLFPTAVQLDS